MKQIRKLVLVITFYLPVSIHAQEGTSSKKGINWRAGISWAQIKQKAKEENKFIFLDCFTTWCGPCKAMEKKVYDKTASLLAVAGIHSLNNFFRNGLHKTELILIAVLLAIWVTFIIGYDKKRFTDRRKPKAVEMICLLPKARPD